MVKNQGKTIKLTGEMALSAVLLLIAFGIGAVVRIQYISGASYPINDGGLFYQMAADLIENGLRIPAFTSYNNDQIPFAYPPLAFYLIALTKLASKQPLIDIFRVFPLVVSILFLPAFFFFSKTIFNDNIKTALSVLIFAMLPRTYEWFIMGGGVTRGVGFLSAILALTFIWQIFSKKPDWKNLAGAILFSAACVLSHPETSLFVVFMAGVFFIYHQFEWRNFKQGLVVAVGVIFCISPWLIAVFSHHGLAPFQGAGSTGHGEWLEIKNFLTLNFGFENGMFLQVVSMFALLALFLKKDKLTYTLAASILIGYFFFPRSGPNLLTMLVAPLSAAGFYQVLILVGRHADQDLDFVQTLESSLKAKIILAFLIIYLILGAVSFKYIIESNKLVLSDDLLNVYSWLDDNLDQEDRIMFYPVAGAERYWWNDYAAEWFPALTTKSNLTTVQGYEWIEGKYQQQVAEYYLLRTCKAIGPTCVEDWETRNDSQIEYLVIGQTNDRQDFVYNFLQQADYEVVYYQNDYLVLRKK